MKESNLQKAIRTYHKYLNQYNNLIDYLGDDEDTWTDNEVIKADALLGKVDIKLTIVEDLRKIK